MTTDTTTERARCECTKPQRGAYGVCKRCGNEYGTERAPSVQSAAPVDMAPERPLTNEEAREICDSDPDVAVYTMLDTSLNPDGVLHAVKFDNSSSDDFEPRRISGLTRSELLAWIKGGA